jgi:hypothetical protein
MPEVVVAYAEADEDAATRVIWKLETLGYKVTRKEAGTRSARRTPLKKSAPPVLLLWSRAFAKSSVPPKRPLATLRLDAATPPPMVKAPAIDLRTWRGREDHRGWRKLQGALAPKSTSIKAAALKPQPKAATKAAALKPQPKAITKAVDSMNTGNDSGPSQKHTRFDALIFLVFLALAGGGAYYALFLHK